LIPPVEVRFVPLAAAALADAPVPHIGRIAPAPPVSPAVTADHADEPAAASGATGAVPPAGAAAVVQAPAAGRHERVRGLWLASLLLALMGGTLVPSPWRQVTSITARESTRVIDVQPRSVAVLPFDNL